MHTTQIYRLILGFMLVGLALTCCGRKPPVIQLTKTMTPATPTNKSPIPTLLPSYTSTIVSPTPSITFTVSPTLYPTNTDTSIPKPTLTDQQKSNLFIKLLQSYNGCLLPCWWGIVPGLTTSEKAKQSLESLGFVNPYEDNQVIAVGENLVGKMGWGYVNITVEKNNNGVGQIDVLSDNLSDPVSFKKLWRRYSPELIIKTYGKPSRIWLGLWPDVPPGGPDRKYELLLFYDSERFLLFYAGNTNFEYGYMCPSYADNGNLEARFGMWLSTADSKVSLENLPGVWIGPVPDYRPIEDVSGLSVTEFYARMLQQKEDFCFRVPADKWP